MRNPKAGIAALQLTCLAKSKKSTSSAIVSGRGGFGRGDCVKGFPDIPPVWWIGSIATIYAGKFLLPGLHVAWPVLNVISILCALASLSLIGWSALWFLRKKTPIEPHQTPASLIIEGPYRLCRNPIYLALVGLTLACALGNGSVMGVVVTCILWWVLDRRFARVEEEMLRRTFPAAADRYIAQTKRWL